MALQVGDTGAGAGMTKAIYDQLDAMLSPPLQQAVDTATDDAGKAAAETTLDNARQGWRGLAFAVSAGVVGHLVGNLEVHGIQTTGNVHAVVSGQNADQNGVVFTQSNNGTGRVS